MSNDKKVCCQDSSNGNKKHLCGCVPRLIIPSYSYPYVDHSIMFLQEKAQKAASNNTILIHSFHCTHYAISIVSQFDDNK